MTHNFGGIKGWFNGKVNNLTPKDVTLTNSFENDLMHIIAVDDSQINNPNT